MRFGSVCSGIEAASVAWNPLGWKAAWFSEIEPFPCAVLAHHYPDVPNLGDMTTLPERILSGEVEAPDLFCGGTPCFTSGHMVLTATGYRDIECLAPGDEVMTHKGRMRKILRVGSKFAAVGRLSAVGLPDGIVCTEEHPFLSSYWRNQSTRRNNVYTKVETCSEPEWVAAKDLPGRQWCALSQVDPTACKPDSRLFDERTAMYVAGMYLGDGWIRSWKGKKKRAVILGINEAKYQKLLAVIGQADHGISRERTSIKVSFWDTTFANWLETNFGHYSHLKMLPAWVMGHPHRDALLQGYIDTDGSVEGSKVAINSTSKSLAHGVCDLLNIQGWSASVAKIETSATCVIEGRTVNQRDYFQVRANHLSISRKSRVRHGYLMRTAQAWEPAGEAMVFNIEVEEDNSFILAGAVVHNCQSFSVAGSRKSLDDARGNLSFTFCEIANAIDTRRAGANQPPSIIFWENVPGVLSTKDNAFGCFLARLAGEDQPIIPSGKKWTNAGVVLGPQRAVAWRILDAQYFGVAQRRRRVFLVASARSGFDPASVLFEFDGVRRDFAPSRETGEDAPVPTPGSIGGHREGFGALRANGGDIGGGSENLVAKCLTAGSGSRYDFETEDFIVHGTQDGKNGIRRFSAAFSAGNSSGARSIAYTEECTPPLRAGASGTNQVPTCISMEVSGWDAAQGHLMVPPTYSISGNIIGRKPKNGGNGEGISKEICYTLTRTDQHGVAHPIAFPANLSATQHASTEDLAPAMGAKNPTAVALQAIGWMEELNASVDLAGTIQRGGDGGRHDGVLTPAMQVRRLTPVECERLQGFEKNYTAIPWRNKSASECPDGPRYKAIGNSWAVPVVNWIGRRIKLALEVAA